MTEQGLTPRKTCNALSKAGGICGQPVISDDIPFCQFHARDLNRHSVQRYTSALPEELRQELEQHLKGDPKDLSSEVAIARTVLSTLLNQMQQAKVVNAALDRLIFAAQHGMVGQGGDRTFQAILTDNEYEALLSLAEEGRAFVSVEVAELIGKFIGRVTSTVESQAKVNPEWVITRDNMRKILEDLIRVIDQALPREMTELRAKVVGDIKEYCMTQVESRKVEVAFGAQPVRGAKG
jgi:hypothetical protein